MEIAKFECSDCKTSYFAEMINVNGRWEIGNKIQAPDNVDGVRHQRMLCGDCQGKGGPGDQLQNIINQQRGLGSRSPFSF